ncbi:hypothetical protein B0T11DRAFT_95552 [Plectosphaerella cucumerina]|uniref:Uncharacterized protein n=1 Tax=Plectosphaerella cucumerina TaxID=40658 RepID=A0A8K0X4D7_9PEZI|nr:hypothetical protein B0T11DRAFT_95552 [Plectosphaerella cucumerina]
MFVLNSTSTDHPALRGVLSDIQSIAKQAVCFSEELVYVPGRTNLMRLPASHAPPAIKELDKIVHENEVLREVLSEWAAQNGLCIDQEVTRQAFQVIWLQGGGISSKEDRVSLYITLPRPKERRSISINEAASLEAEVEPVSQGFVQRTITDGQKVGSTFKCHVGDIFILRGGEQLHLLGVGTIKPRDICAFATTFRATVLL